MPSTAIVHHSDTSTSCPFCGYPTIVKRPWCNDSGCINRIHRTLNSILDITFWPTWYPTKADPFDTCAVRFERNGVWIFLFTKGVKMEAAFHGHRKASETLCNTLKGLWSAILKAHYRLARRRLPEQSRWEELLKNPVVQMSPSMPVRPWLNEHYRILKIENPEPQSHRRKEQIRLAHRRLARVVHPDAAQHSNGDMDLLKKTRDAALNDVDSETPNRKSVFSDAWYRRLNEKTWMPPKDHRGYVLRP